MGSEAQVQMRPVVTNMHLKQPWCPNTTVVDGVHYVELDKWDRKFILFCTGRGLNLNPGKRHDINYSFLEDLQKLRTKACDKALADAYADETNERPAKRVRKARLSDRDVAGHVVQIKGPDLQRGGVHIQGVTLQVLFGVKHSSVWMELTAANLEYIRNGVLMSMEQNEVGRKWSAKMTSQVDSEREDDDDAEGSSVGVQHSAK
jgi:hypothetical protein